MQIACTLLLIISMVLAPVVPAGAFFPSFDELSAKTAQAKQLRSYQATWIIQGMASEKTSDPSPNNAPSQGNAGTPANSADESRANATGTATGGSFGDSNGSNSSGETFHVSIIQSGQVWYQDWSTGHATETPKVVAAALGQEADLLASYPSAASFPMPPLYYWHVIDLSVLASTLNVDVQQMRFAFFENRPCLVLGSDTGGQIWLDNEHKMPVRLVSGPLGWSLEFTRYTQLQGFWIPRFLQASFPDGTTLHGEVKWGAPNSPQVRSVLNTNAFQQRFGGFAPPKETARIFEVFGRDFSLAAKP